MPTNVPPDYTPRRLLRLLQDISLGVDQAQDTDEAFAAVLGHICRYMDWPLGHVYVWSAAADRLVSSGVWHIEDPQGMASFRKLSEATDYGRDEGTVGRVWATGAPVTILDVRDDDSFVRQLPIEEGGIRAYFAFPVKINKDVVAVMEFFSPEAVSPKPETAEVINHVSLLLGLAMQRQQIFEQLVQSEAQLAEAQRTAHVGHWEWDIAQDRVTWSPELYRIYGLEPGQLEATYEGVVVQRTHPADLEYVTRQIAQAYEYGRPFDHFHRIIRADGAVRVIHSRGRPIFDRAGNISRLHGTVQDMTEHKETELKLAQTVRRLSAVMEIGQSVAATLELDQIYGKVLALALPLTAAEVIMLLLERDGALEIVAVEGEDEQIMGPMRGARAPLAGSIVGEVWRSGQSTLIQGSQAERLRSANLSARTGYLPAAVLAAPVRWQEETLGVLAAVHRDAEAFSVEDLQPVESAATWTAIAIANARQYAAIQRRLAESDAILAISNAMTETLDLDELLQTVVRQMLTAVPHTDWTAIHLLRAGTDRLELAASAGLEIEPEAYAVTLGDGIAGEVMATGTIISVPDMQQDPRRLEIDVNIRARAMLVAPVESRQRRIGTISMQCSQPDTFGPDEERLLKILGVQAGMAIENARLYAQQQFARLRAEKQRERMRQMARRVVEAQEAERARIARELHDESGQALTSLKISLTLLRAQLPGDLSRLQDSVDEVLELTDKTMSNLRLLSHNLRPPGLDTYGLDAALEGLCEDFKMHTRLEIDYSGCEAQDLPDLAALSLYRFAQEALTNAAKHAQATAVTVTLRREEDMMKLVVADNGRGFVPPDVDQASAGNGAGLMGMLERLEMVNGRLHIDSTAGNGSRLTAVVPIEIESA